jgi:hypothetical protein
MTVCGTGFEPADPCVSTTMSTPRRAAAAAPHAAARGVWANAGGQDDAAAGGRGLGGSGLGRSFLRGRRGRRRDLDDVADEADDLVRSLGGAQGVGEVLLHQRPGELGEQLQVGGVPAGRRGDQEGEVGRSVLGAEVGRGGEPGEGQGRYVDVLGAAVRDRDAAGQAGRGRGLSGEGVLGQAVGVAAAAGLAHDSRQGADDVVLVGAERGVEPHQ